MLTLFSLISGETIKATESLGFDPSPLFYSFPHCLEVSEKAMGGGKRGSC